MLALKIYCLKIASQPIGGINTEFCLSGGEILSLARAVFAVSGNMERQPYLPCQVLRVSTLAAVLHHNYFKFLNSGIDFRVLFSKLYENPDQHMKLVLRDGYSFSVSRSTAI